MSGGGERIVANSSAPKALRLPYLHLPPISDAVGER